MESKKIIVIIRRIFLLLTAPLSKEKDDARREFILNVLLFGAILLSFVANIQNWIRLFFASATERSPYTSTSLEIFFVFLIFLFGYFLSRIGKFRVAAYGLLGLYLLGAMYTAYAWGANVPMALLLYALIIVMSGILIGSRFAFGMTGFIAFFLITLTYLQQTAMLTVNSSWRTKLPTLFDGIVYSITLLVIALVSWLFNREMERALKRVRLSENALRRQRDNLEVLVERRTKELRSAQAEKLEQLYRFAEFGRLASGLFHDLVNPLNLVSLNLERLTKHSRNDIQLQEISEVQVLLKRATAGTKRLESFIDVARKQVQNRDTKNRFSLVSEINEVIQMLDHRAKKEKVKLSFMYETNITTYNNPIKFSQLIANLIANAIDAYDGIIRKDKQVLVALKKEKSVCIISVQDFGCGIADKALSQIFDPLFTTKSFEKGTGMGLAICKDIVEKDFHGNIAVASKKNNGSIFFISFPLHRARK